MNILFIFGTRPEAIKMAPLINECKKHQNLFNVQVCVTAQHREMLDQVLNFFNIQPDYDLNLMSPNQTLFDITSKALHGIGDVVDKAEPDLIFVQGDTTTVFAGALAAFYKKIKIAHLEAGLRSHNKYSPFPEEGNRILTSHIADLHFAPTENAINNLNEEGISKNLWDVGNTVIDALLLGLTIIEKKDLEESIIEYFNKCIVDFSNLLSTKKIVLVTGHRRESFGEPFENICQAILDIVTHHKDIEIIYPVHLNPNVRKVVNEKLKQNDRIHLIEPLEYPHMIWLMNKSHLILTDSGGIQEEGPSLGKPVLVMREVTERQEGVEAGTAKLVGTDRNRIFEEANILLSENQEYDKMANTVNPYGDGTTSVQIANILKEMINKGAI